MAITALKLPAALEKFVAGQVEEGAYRTAEAAIIGAVLNEKRRAEQRAWLESEIEKGLNSGPATELDMKDVIRRVRARLAARKKGRATR